MKRMSAPLFAAALGLTLFSQSQASASFVPWTYNWTPSTTSISSDVPGTGGLSLTNEPLNHAIGSSDIVVTNIRSFSSAPRTSPDKFTAKPYSVTLFLQDDASGAHANLTFTGAFGGTLSINSANVTNAFSGLTQQTVQLGTHKYIVQIGSYAPPGPPTASNAGSISAHVFVDEDPNTGGGGGGQHAPEPSTMLLSLLGLSGLGASAWRKLKSKI
jgi:hypothetical protein